MRCRKEVRAPNSNSMEQSCLCVQLTALADAANCKQVILFQCDTSKLFDKKTVLPLIKKIPHVSSVLHT